MSRRLSVVAAVTLVAVSLCNRAYAQVQPSREAAIELRKQFITDLDSLQGRFLALAEAFPAEKYSWRPAPGIRSVGEVFKHVASEYYVWAPMAYGVARSPVIGRGADSMKAFESASDKAEVLKQLREGFAYTRSSITALDPSKITGKQKLFGQDMTIIETSFAMTDDLHEHLGQLIAYARMNGVVPPWSK